MAKPEDEKEHTGMAVIGNLVISYTKRSHILHDIMSHICQGLPNSCRVRFSLTVIFWIFYFPDPNL